MMIWDDAWFQTWPRILMQSVGTGLGFLWAWAGRAMILAAILICHRSRPSKATRLCIAGCLMYIVGRSLQDWGWAIAPHPSTTYGVELWEYLASGGYLVWQTGSLLLAGGILWYALYERKTRQKQPAQPPAAV